MNIHFMCFIFCHTNIILIQIHLSCCMAKEEIKRWYVGRTPPSSFEYSKINGFYTPNQAQSVCEKDRQCGGFTFKGTKRVKDMIPEVYFFHYIDKSSKYITTEIKYPHWTTYIVGSRDYIIIGGSYLSQSNNRRRLIRYTNFSQPHSNI